MYSDPYPAIFVINLQEANKKTDLKINSAYYGTFWRYIINIIFQR